MPNDIMDRIREYLSVGGLFNPELMPADKVRDIVIDCRTEIESLRSRLAEVEIERDNARLAATQNKELVEWNRSRLADAEREARVLVVAMADKCGAPDNWKPLPDAAGMITQISNMVAGLRDERALLVTRAENAEAALVEADKDAERYRWLRDRAWPFEFNGDTPEDADAAIDAAMHLAARPAAAKKHTPECSYWDGLMAQVCNCGAADSCQPACRHSQIKIIKQGESARCLDCGTVISLVTPADWGDLDGRIDAHLARKQGE
jgi:hypothetical protein